MNQTTGPEPPITEAMAERYTRDDEACIAASVVEDEFRKYEAHWIGVAEFPDRLAIFRAGWDAACGHRPYKSGGQSGR